ncbi:MAG: fasciclin domain-containing protein [Ilumatobacteraceae bacterium]
MNVPTANATVHIIDSVLMPKAATTTASSMAPESTTAASSAMMGAFGSGCTAVPANGAGSFAGMADAPAATAASANPVLSTLVAAVKAAGLVDTLNGPGPFTIFAPSNDAFAKIPAKDLDAVLANKDQLTSILTLHVIAGKKLSVADLVAAGSETTVNGQKLSFTKNADGALEVNGQAAGICMNVPTANATVHIIDSVLMPKA